MSYNKKYKILFTGGGTGGSVTPLLAVAEELKTPYPNLSPIPIVMVEREKSSSFSHEERMGEGQGGGYDFLWLGTKYGPESEMVERAGIKFRAISGGKWRRYFSFKNLADIVKIKLGFWQAFFIILKWRPDLVMSAGSFISVPVVWAAWLLSVPVLIHQQDICPGLANKLMSWFAKVVTVAFEKSLADYGKKAIWTGNPVRKLLITNNSQLISVNKSLPVLLILGGGTGAMAINKLVENCLGELTKFCQIIHITGKEKGSMNNESRIMNYGKYEFLNVDDMATALNSADLVVTRAGLGILSELSSLAKPAIIIPIPDSHQEENAAFFRNKKAAIVAKQKYLTPENFTHLVKNLLADEKMLAKLSTNMGQAMKRGANQAMVKIIKDLLK